MPEATPCCELLDAELWAATLKAWIIIGIGCSVTAAQAANAAEIFSDRFIVQKTLLRHSSISGIIGLMTGHSLKFGMAMASPTSYSWNAFASSPCRSTSRPWSKIFIDSKSAFWDSSSCRRRCCCCCSS